MSSFNTCSSVLLPFTFNIFLFLTKKLSSQLIVLPLYPHNAISTTLSTEIAVKNIVNKFYPELRIIFKKPFYDNPIYIEALSKSIEPFINNIDKLIFSYHGIPNRHIIKGDVTKSHCMKDENCCEISCIASQNCYRSNVMTTSNLCAKNLNLSDEKWMITFQSRVTIIDPNWLRPYTDIELTKLPENGIKNIAIVCPSFTADCLETLDEIQKENDSIRVIGINIDEDIADAQEFISQYNISFLSLIDEEFITIKYGVTKIPETFFIDPEGKIISRVSGNLTKDKIKLLIDDLAN